MSLALWEYFWTPAAWSSGPATGLTLSGPTSGTVSLASTAFTCTANGSISGVCVVTLAKSGGTGTFTPTTLSLSAGTTSQTFTYTPTTLGPHSLTCTNNQGLSNGSALTYTVAAAVVPTPDIPGKLSTAGGGGGHKKDHGDPFPIDMDEVREGYLRNLHPEPAVDIALEPVTVIEPDRLPDLLREAMQNAMRLQALRSNMEAQAQDNQAQQQLQELESSTKQMSLDLQKLMDQNNTQSALILLLDTI